MKLRPRAWLIGLTPALFALAWIASAPARPQEPAKPGGSSVPPARPVDYRQVTVFGMVADPKDPAIDKKLEKYAVQLRRLRPGHGFRFRGNASRRLAAGETLACDLGRGVTAKVELQNAMNRNGKVQFKFELAIDGKTEFATTVTTPPNQIFYIEKVLPHDQRLLIGVGGR